MTLHGGELHFCAHHDKAHSDRLKQVAFTNTHFLTATRFVSKKSSKLNSIDDLKGKPVASTSG